MLQSTNPYTSEVIATIAIDDAAAIQSKIAKAYAAHIAWRATPIEQRCKAIASLAQVLIENKDVMAQTATAEMGKHIRESRAEVEKCAITLQHYAAHAVEYLADKHIATEATSSYISYQSLGLILAIMPWNFPYWQVFRAMAPILLTGNGMLLKHASSVSLCAGLIRDAVCKSEIPDDLFQWLQIQSDSVSSIIALKHIQGVTLTGSTQAGSAVASVAAKHIKKQVLELGGSDAYLVLADAPIHEAVAILVKSRMQNAGQSCISAKRIIVDASIYDAFISALVDKVQDIQYGDPMDEHNDIGVLVSVSARAELHQQVLDCIAKGAKLWIGGTIPEGSGSAYPPTIISDITSGMSAWSEELFGPVFVVIRADDEHHAIHIANDHQYGLGGGVISSDVAKATYIATHQMLAGFVAVNDFARSDARLPFGGVKQSGYGRELSALGMYEFCNIKTVVVK